MALILDWTPFRGFRDAFDAPEIRWDLDPAYFERKLMDIEQGDIQEGAHRGFALSHSIYFFQ